MPDNTKTTFSLERCIEYLNHELYELGPRRSLVPNWDKMMMLEDIRNYLRQLQGKQNAA